MVSCRVMRLMRTSLLFVTASLWAQDFSKIQIEKAAGGYTFTEGPAWSREGGLYFSDVPANRIYKLTLGEPPAVFRDASNGANGNTFDSQGRLLTCESKSRRVTRTDKSGKVEVLADKFEGKRLNAPNDIVARRDGNIYFTDPAFGTQATGRELDFYGIYRILSNRTLELVAKTTGRPNGIALSPKGDKLYVADSDERLIRVFDVDRAGKVSNEQVLISNIDGPPDGIRTDEKGNIWVACNLVSVYSAAGQPVGKIELGEKPRNLSFGEPDLQTLFITAFTSVYRVRLDVKGVVAY